MAKKKQDQGYHDGRDELNLADFPISVLQRQQPLDEQGTKLDTAVYEASRYNAELRQKQQQRVILEATTRHGLPTPADENVVLALLYVAKHTHDFAEPVVRFTPRQLFAIMGWAPNSRSYDRLRQVLRRLQSLVIRYENSWWDVAGRAYEAELATGIISEYELGRQVSGRKEGATPPCWVCWTPHFQRSLSNGNLKKLDLERLFSLRLPTAQRMYRFLDKRFYPPHAPPPVEMDLYDFACGHIGLTRVDNVAELKRRLAPAIAELEEIGFIARVETEERYQKMKPGIWRIRFKAGPEFRKGISPPLLPAPAKSESEAAPAVRVVEKTAEGSLAADFYRRRGAEDTRVGESDLAQAREMIARHGAELAAALVPDLVQLVQRKWPECKSFSGAVQKYLAEAVRAHELRQRRSESNSRAKVHQQREREQSTRQAEERRRLEARWEALSDEQRQAIEQSVLVKRPGINGHPGIFRMLCLEQMARMETAG